MSCMITKELQIVMQLLRAALNEIPFSVGDQPVDWDKVQNCLKQHRVESMAAVGCQYVQDVQRLPETFKEALNYAAQVGQAQEAYQFFALENMRQAFSAAKIDFLPLKGSVLKMDYPQPFMRSMCDLDILFREEQFDQVRPVMESIGFQFEYSSPVDDSYKSGKVHVEAHHKLIAHTLVYDVYADYYDTVWDRAVKLSDTTCEYGMTWEEYYLFMITHAAKHFQYGGTGLRIFTDLSVFWKKHGKDVDVSCVRKGLQTLKLEKFEQMLRALTDRLLEGDGTLTKEQEMVFVYMVNSGAYGKNENFELNRMLDENNAKTTAGTRAYKLWRTLFPTRAVMEEEYPWLKEHGILLAAAWPLRLGNRLIHLPKSMHKVETILTTDEVKIDQHRQLLELVGMHEEQLPENKDPET